MKHISRCILISLFVAGLPFNIKPMEKKEVILYGCLGGLCAFGLSKAAEKFMQKAQTVKLINSADQSFIKRIDELEIRLGIASDVAHGAVNFGQNNEMQTRLHSIERRLDSLEKNHNKCPSIEELLKASNVNDCAEFGETFRTSCETIDQLYARSIEAERAVKELHDQINGQKPKNDLPTASKRDLGGQGQDELRPV